MKQDDVEVLKLLEKGEISVEEASARMTESSESKVVAVSPRSRASAASLAPRMSKTADAQGRVASFVAVTAAAAVVGLIAGAIGLGAIVVATAALVFGAILIGLGILLIPLSWVVGLFGFAKPSVRLPVIDWWRRRR